LEEKINSELFKPLRLKTKKVLAIFAHPDDETLSGGNFLLYCKKKKIETRVCILSKGERGKCLSKNISSDLSGLRAKELKKACAYLGVKSVIHLDFPDMDFVSFQELIIKKLRRIIKKEKIEMVITHSFFENPSHPDHLITSFCVFKILKEIEKERPALLFPIDSFPFFSKSKLLDKKNLYFIRTRGFLKAKEKACSVYKSQLDRKTRRALYWNDFFFDKKLYYRVDFKKEKLAKALKNKLENIKKIYLKVAGLIVEVNGLNKKTEMIIKQKYKNFIINLSSTSEIKTVKNLLKIWLIYKDKGESQIKKINNNFYHIDLVNNHWFSTFNSMLKKIFINFLTRNKGLALHASSVLDKQKNGILFVGQENAGKSSLLKAFPLKFSLADDVSFITYGEKQSFVYGSPFYERNKTAHIQVKVPIKAIFFLHRGEELRIKELTFEKAHEQIFPNIWLFRNDKQDRAINLLTFWWETIYNVLKGVKCFNLYFKETEPALELLEKEVL